MTKTYKISEIALLTELPIATIRYYEELDLLNLRETLVIIESLQKLTLNGFTLSKELKQQECLLQKSKIILA